jgi:hypothetical protein
MSSPYLESGESIIMTTDRVSVEMVTYDAILTTRRLILMDNHNFRFEPRILLLSAIGSVRSGKAATGEPAIILTLEMPGNAPENKTIIFCQNPPENRKQDRDQWVQKFIELSISSKDELPQKPEVPRHKPEGMRPSTRRWVAPETIRPYTDSHRIKVEVPDIEVTPDEAEPAPSAPAKPSLANRHVTGGNDESPDDETDNYRNSLSRATQLAVQSVMEPEADITPRRWEPERNDAAVPEPSGIAPGIDEPAYPELFPGTPGPLSQAILAAARSLTSRKEQDDDGEPVPVPVQADIRMTSLLPESPLSPTGPAPVPETPGHPDTSAAPEIPVPDTLPGEIPDTSVLPESPAHPPVLAVPPESVFPPGSTGTVPALHESLPEPVHVDVDAGSSLPVPVNLRGPETPLPEKSRPEETPAPLHDASSSGRYPRLIAGGVILILLLALGGVFLLPGTLPPDHGPVTIAPTTVPPESPGPIPAPSPVTIPGEGVWVRITTPGYFVGQYGNPGSLQQVSGYGEKFYKIRDSSGIVKVSVAKQENTGDELLVEIYRNGTVIASRLVTAPMGSVDLLIDPLTGKPPGLNATGPAGNTTGSSGLVYL